MHFLVLQPLEEQILSQRMDQLSTNAPNEKSTIMKIVQDELNKIPAYLTKK